MCRRSIYKKHPAAVTGTHLKAVFRQIPHERDCIPGDDSQAGFQRIKRRPQNTMRTPIQLRDGNSKSCGPVYAVYVFMTRFLIRNDKSDRVMNGFPQKKGFFVLF